MIDITPIIEVLFILIGTLLTVLVIPLLVNKYGAEKVATVEYWIGVAVSAAEQIYSAYEGKQGANKKQYVLDFLESIGLTYDENKVDAMIEAAVKKLKRNE